MILNLLSCFNNTASGRSDLHKKEKKMRKISRITAVLLSIFLFSLPILAQQRVALTNEEKLLVYSNVLQALGQIGDPKATPLFIKGLKSREYLIRQYAVSGIGALNKKEANPSLKKLVIDENYVVKILAIKTLVSDAAADCNFV